MVAVNSICPVAGVRKNSLMVLTHLIMNDMMKVKGHIARMALCLQDPHPRIKDLAHLFFHELAQKNYKVTDRFCAVLINLADSCCLYKACGQCFYQGLIWQLSLSCMRVLCNVVRYKRIAFCTLLPCICFTSLLKLPLSTTMHAAEYQKVFIICLTRNLHDKTASCLTCCSHICFLKTG